MVRIEALKYYVCANCKAEWSKLATDDLCHDCAAEKDKADLAARNARATLVHILGGEKAAQELVFEKFQVTPGNEYAYTRALNFSATYGSLYLWGKPGRGKSFLAWAIAHRAHLAGLKVGIYSPRALLNKFRKKEPAEELKTMEEFIEMDVLVIDDLGVSKATEYALEILAELFTRRGHRGRHGGIVITSNLFIGELAEKNEDDRLVSRISEICEIVEVGGDRDYRLPLDPQGALSLS